MKIVDFTNLIVSAVKNALECPVYDEKIETEQSYPNASVRLLNANIERFKRQSYELTLAYGVQYRISSQNTSNLEALNEAGLNLQFALKTLTDGNGLTFRAKNARFDVVDNALNLFFDFSFIVVPPAESASPTMSNIEIAVNLKN